MILGRDDGGRPVAWSCMKNIMYDMYVYEQTMCRNIEIHTFK
jgi:hypothetical protein